MNSARISCSGQICRQRHATNMPQAQQCRDPAAASPPSRPVLVPPGDPKKRRTQHHVLIMGMPPETGGRGPTRRFLLNGGLLCWTRARSPGSSDVTTARDVRHLQSRVYEARPPLACWFPKRGLFLRKNKGSSVAAVFTTSTHAPCRP